MGHSGGSLLRFAIRIFCSPGITAIVCMRKNLLQRATVNVVASKYLFLAEALAILPNAASVLTVPLAVLLVIGIATVNVVASK